MIQSGKGAQAAMEIIVAFSHGTFPKDLMYFPGTRAYRGAWQETIAAAETYNEPGRFTAFIGYEWTSNTGGNNLHRNVIFRDNGDKAGQVEPFTVYPPMGSDNPVNLWKWMDAYEQKTGGSVLAIAHNGNLSNGTMFPIVEAFGKPLDRAYAETRARWERLYEATQTKGDGETHPFLSPNDEFADFQRWDKGNLDGSVAKTKAMLEFEYFRSAYKNGLKLEQTLGVNPYKFGMAAGSDAHTGLTAMEEDNFFGKTTPGEPSPERLHATFMANPKSGVTIKDWEVCASGYTAVWANENTRESLWDAMQRKETYGTTGTRMIVRFFGGWAFDAKDAEARSPAVTGYAKGVPMGGELAAAPAGQSPSFLVAALRDPVGANLDRIQVVKGWLDAAGELREKVYDVAWSGNRKPGRGRQAPVGGHHGRRRERHVDEHHRRPRARLGLEGPGLRRDAAGLLLRARDRDPHAALDGLRRQALRRDAAARHVADPHRARLHVAYLVLAEVAGGSVRPASLSSARFGVSRRVAGGILRPWARAMASGGSTGPAWPRTSTPTAGRGSTRSSAPTSAAAWSRSMRTSAAFAAACRWSGTASGAASTSTSPTPCPSGSPPFARRPTRSCGRSPTAGTRRRGAP